MFERIWDEDPKVQAITSEAKKKGWQQGIEKGEIKTLRTTTLAVISAHFPGLLELAERQLAQIDDPARLQQLFNEILTAPNGDVVYKLLKDQ
jgi:hypothetical protein